MRQERWLFTEYNPLSTELKTTFDGMQYANDYDSSPSQLEILMSRASQETL